ncbi:MAG: MBL fold metallo-hydrolase [Calditrichia bacterium]
MPDLSLTVIGSGTLVPDTTRSCSANLIVYQNERILVDMGFGTLASLTRLHINPLTISTLYITHFHPDHVADLIPLIFTRIHAGAPVNQPLKIVGPFGIEAFLIKSAAAYGDWLITAVKETTRIVEIGSGHHPISDGFCEAFPMKHAPESLGYRFQFGEYFIAMTGDTGYCENAIDVCKNADIAIVECGALEDGGNHLSPAEVARIAIKAQPRQLLINHCYPKVVASNPVRLITDKYTGQVEHAYDGLVLNLEANQDD